jgi:hypothetical protein
MLDRFAKELLVFLIDDCSNHITNDMARFATEVRMRIGTLALHATPIFQVIDVRLFGVLQRNPRSALPFGDEKTTVKYVIKVHHEFKSTMITPNISAAFQALEFEFETRTERDRLLFN